MTKGYLVSVCGSNAPTVIHQDFESAKSEAERLSKIRQNMDRTIYVVELVAVLKPVSSHAWETLP